MSSSSLFDANGILVLPERDPRRKHLQQMTGNVGSPDALPRCGAWRADTRDDLVTLDGQSDSPLRVVFQFSLTNLTPARRSRVLDVLARVPWSKHANQWHAFDYFLPGHDQPFVRTWYNGDNELVSSGIVERQLSRPAGWPSA